MTLLVAALLVALAASVVYGLRLRAQRQTLLYELRRVLRAGAGRVEAQDTELGSYRTLFEVVPLPLLATDARRGMLRANPAAQQLFGPIEPGEAAIKRLRHHQLEALLDQALHNGATEPLLVELPGEQQFLATAYRWSLPSGEVGGSVLVLRNMTELNRLHRARRDMAANLSHELRTPLASVKLMTETLLSGAIEQPELARKFVSRIAIENEALIRLVEDLTALSWIESGRTPLRLERVNLRTLIEQRLQRLAPHAEQQGLHFHLDSPPDVTLFLDPERFGQVLSNLLDNAIKFSPKEGTIFLTVAQNAQQCTLAIRDEGPGIFPTDLPRIFERFYKGDRVRTRSKAAGTGLGLAIAKHLVEAHGGTLHAESRLGHGATFVITLPHE